MIKKDASTKNKGQVFTPAFLVDIMLNAINYNSDSEISKKHIIDNSCGDGAFLTEIVFRYCTYSKSRNNPDLLRTELETYIHGIELDKTAYDVCINNLNSIANSFGIYKINWDILNEDALLITKFNNKMDYVIGNPPYVRIHNLNDSYNQVKEYNFANEGMTDLYLAFFELGFNMLNNNGKLCYITPNSWLSSIAASNMRNYIIKHKNLHSIVDFHHFQPFKNATVYATISLFDNKHNSNDFALLDYIPETNNFKYKSTLSLQDAFIDNQFYVGSINELHLLKEIKEYKNQNKISVKNGFATLADDVFINDFIPDSNITIPIIKASTGKETKCIFPYDDNGKLYSQDTVFANPEIKNYLLENKQKLLKGKIDNPQFYQYGRTQALKDVSKDKIILNNLIRNISDLKIKFIQGKHGVYSGLYILINDNTIHYSKIIELLKSEQFISYIKSLKKYKSGGYYTYSSKDVEQYLNFFCSM